LVFVVFVLADLAVAVFFVVIVLVLV